AARRPAAAWGPPAGGPAGGPAPSPPPPPHQRYMRGITEAVRQAVGRGNVVLVGRGTRHLVGDNPGALHLRLVAPREQRVERMARREGWSHGEARARGQQVEHTRRRLPRYVF